MTKKKTTFVLTTTDVLLEVLEKEIAEGRNPKTPKDWERVMILVARKQGVQSGVINGTPEELYENLENSLGDQVNIQYTDLKKKPD